MFFGNPRENCKFKPCVQIHFHISIGCVGRTIKLLPTALLKAQVGIVNVLVRLNMIILSMASGEIHFSVIRQNSSKR
jgi:hypothetical protein